MALSADTQKIRCPKQLKNESMEYTVSEELTLPDYCPDMARMLLCSSEAMVSNVSVNQGKACINGKISVLMWYTDPQASLCFYRKVLEYQLSPEAPEDTDFLSVEVANLYINARPVGPKKSELQGALTCRLTYYKTEQTDVFVEAVGDGVQTKKTDITVTDWIGNCEKKVCISDEIPITAGSLHTVLRSTARVANVEVRPMNGRVMVKGELEVSALYRNGEGGFDTLMASVPFSQLAELPEAKESDTVQADFRVTSLELRGRTGMDGECRQISVAAELMMYLYATQTIEMTAITDVYSTQCGLQIKRLNQQLPLFLPTQVKKEQITFSMDTGREITRVIDLSCQARSGKNEIDDGTLSQNGEVMFTAVLIDGQGEPYIYEKSLPFTFQYAMEGEYADVKSTVLHQAYTIVSATRLEVTASIENRIIPVATVDCPCITELLTDPDCPVERPQVPLVVYYARAGEEVFEIARRYAATTEAIQKANSLQEEVLSQSRPLLIPLPQCK